MIHLLLFFIYISFISLGLPDALLGSAWPTMYTEFSVSVSWAGIISIIISFGTIISSLVSDRLTFKLGTGKVTTISVAMTAAALLGFSCSNSFWLLCLWAIPYGLGAGSVDASLNNYVALHYDSHHMSWLHCMWGLGASTGPYIMGYLLSGGAHWTMGYRVIGFLQIILSASLFFSLPLWKERRNTVDVPTDNVQTSRKPLSFAEIFGIPGAKEIMITFFCYCALEQTAGLWASSYLVLYKGIARETAATFASLFYVGITVGRALNGFLTMKFSDSQLIRLGQTIIALGIVTMLLPMSEMVSLIGLILIGLGCAPIYPCVIHSTPANFGAENSQALIGVQMASAYIGTLLMPSLFGLLADYISVMLLPIYLFAILTIMFVMYEKMIKKCTSQDQMRMN